MKKKITIAIDAMGGENSPKKNIEGLSIFLKKNQKKDDFLIKVLSVNTNIYHTRHLTNNKAINVLLQYKLILFLLNI